jgi:glycosyltransferase involved in cell wall biosynthesis
MIWLLDKADPPVESFIDGMLADALPKTARIRVILITSRHRAGRRRPYRYGRAICIPTLLPRRHVARFFNLWVAARMLQALQGRLAHQQRRWALFVRNEPVFLAAAVWARQARASVVFQQSFPHERFAPNPVKRFVARWILWACRGGVDGLVAVSPLGLERLEKAFPNAKQGTVIPLLAPQVEGVSGDWLPNRHRPCECVYIGAHDPARRLDVVLAGVGQAIDRGVELRVTLIGGQPRDCERLRRQPGVAALEAAGHVRFLPPMPRHDLLTRLSGFDVGLSLIPPTAVYREASPTKLTEYLGAGLAVLASAGIPLQSQFVRRAGAGELVAFEPGAIAEGLACLAQEPAATHRQRREAGRAFAMQQLRYQNYGDGLSRWLDRPV